MQPDPPEPTLPKLSRREKEVLIDLSNGYHYPEIAERLGITRQNAWQYAANACDKLGASTDLQGVVLAIVLGLIPLPAETPVNAP